VLTLQQLREAAGGLDGVSDEQIVDLAFAKYGKYYPDKDAFAKDFGYTGAGRTKSGSRWSAAVDQYQANLYGLGEATADKYGIPEVGSWARSGRERNEESARYATERARSLGAVDDWRNVGSVSDAADYAAGLAINTAPQMGAMAGAAAVGTLVTRSPLGGLAGAALAGYPSNVGTILGEQREQAGTTDLGSAAALAVPYTAIDTLTGAESAVVRAASGNMRKAATGSLPTRVGKGIVRGSVEEAAGEVVQTGLEQAGRMAVDPNEGFLSEGAQKRFADAAVGGATLGGVFGGAGGVRSRKNAVGPGADDTQSTDLLGSAPSWTTTQGFDPAPPQILPTTPLGDTTPDWTTSPGATAPRPPAMDPAGMVPSFDDPAVTTGRQPLGSQLEIPAVPGRPDLPDVMVAGQPPVGVAADETGNQAMVEPGAIESRRVMQASESRAAQERQAQELAVQQSQEEFAARRKAAHDELVQNDEQGKPMIQLKQPDIALHRQVTQLRDEGKIDAAQHAGYIGAMREALEVADRSSMNAIRKEVQAKAEAAVPSKTPENVVQDVGYEKLSKRPVTIQVFSAEGKPVRRTIKDARVALEEADDRASKYEQLARCLGHV
jgi:hypothetical protein